MAKHGVPFLASPEFQSMIKEYRRPRVSKAVIQLCNSFIPFVGFWLLAVLALPISYPLTLICSVLAVGFMVRVFIIQHDCGHGSFFQSKKANDIIGSIFGVITITPYQHWRHSHKIHHASSGDLTERGTGDIWTLTITEYRQRNRWQRFVYSSYRHPIMLFVLGPPIMFLFFNRVPPGHPRTWFQKKYANIWWTDLAIITLGALMVTIIGWKAFLMVQLPINFLAANLGTWLFYVQHQFEDTYWEPGQPGWNFHEASMKGSSYYKLPRVLQWFTGNIGFHHVHHLCPNIANYNLPNAHEDIPELQDVTTITLRESLVTARLTLWDTEQKKLVSFQQAGF